MKVRMISAWSLGKLHDRIAVPALLDALEDESFEVRNYAVEAIGIIGDVSALGIIKERMVKEDHDEVRQTLLNTFTRLDELENE